MKNFIKIATVGLALTLAAATLLTGCGKMNAKTTVRTADLTIKRTAEVLGSLENIQDKQFKFPAAFDKDFAQTQTLKTKQKRARYQRANKYDEYIDKLDGLYLTCAEISEKNAQIAAKSAEIRDLLARTKELRNQLKNNQSTLDNPQDLYTEIEAQCVSTRQNLERLYSDRRSITKQIKTLPNTNNMNVDVANVRYERIVQRLDYRLQLLDTIKSDLEKLNQKLCTALGICEEPATPEVSTEPVQMPRHIIIRYPVIQYA